MRKANMLRFLSFDFDMWEDVYTHFDMQKTQALHPCVFGWYMAFDGPSLGEMYLTNEHPSSDLSGDTITINDFNEVKT